MKLQTRLKSAQLRGQMLCGVLKGLDKTQITAIGSKIIHFSSSYSPTDAKIWRIWTQRSHPGTCGTEFIVTKLSVVTVLQILCCVDSKRQPNMQSSRPVVPRKIPSECSDLHFRRSENICTQPVCLSTPRCVCVSYRLLYLWPVMRVQWVRSAFRRRGNKLKSDALYRCILYRRRDEQTLVS